MIELKHVSKTYDSGANGGVDALKDVSLTIEDGDIYGIIGMSGAGKSTLVRCINLLERPTKGEIIVDGQRLDTMTPAQLRAARSWAGVMVSSHWPSTMISPSVGRSSRLMHRTSVLLPAPDIPIMP